MTTLGLGRMLLAQAFDLRARKPAPERAAQAPRSPFPPRRDLVAGEDESVAILIAGRHRRLGSPMEWELHADRDGCRSALEIFDLHSMRWVEALDDARFQASVRDWIDHVPARAATLARAGWSRRALPVRLVVWMQQIAARGHRLPAAFTETAARSIALQVRCLHATIGCEDDGLTRLESAKALCWAGRFFEGRDAARWLARGARVLERELQSRFLADGVHAERSPAVHARACTSLLECRVVLPGRAQLDAAIERACAALADLVHPDGCPSLLGGGGLHAGHAPAAIFAAANRLCGVHAIRRPHVVLDDAGYCGWRDGKTYFLFACGSTGAGSPAGVDALAIEWTLHGERVIVSPGGSGARSEARARVVRTRLQLLPDGLVAEGLSHAGAHLSAKPLQRRLLRSTLGDLRIEDRIEGGADEPASALLLCHPSARLRLSADGSVTIRQGRVFVRVESSGRITIEDALWHPDAGLAVRTKRIVVHYGTAPCTGSIRIQNLVPQPPEMVALAAVGSR